MTADRMDTLAGGGAGGGGVCDFGRSVGVAFFVSRGIPLKERMCT